MVHGHKSEYTVRVVILIGRDVVKWDSMGKG